MRLRLVSRELVEDLNLRRFCIADQRRFPRDAFWIDDRRLKRELRKLPKLRAAAQARFEAQLEELRYQRRTYGCEYYYKANGQMVSREDLRRIRELVNAALVHSIQPVADMSSPRPKG